MKLGILVITLVLLFNAGALGYSFCLHSKSVCLLPKDPGPCRGSFPRYYFDKSSGQCKKFIYGGCRGNGNNFLTLKDCETTCTCYFPKDIGPCDGYFPRYYFNYCTQKCEKFIYGGCGGNKNNFVSITDCYKTCPCNQFLEIPPVNLDSICYLPKEVGPCKALIPQYFYNKCTRKCELFFYGGCLGNKNNFKTLKECNSKCFYPPVKG
ncbi:hypothetical protein ACROYT_G022627 [Oculina patagonica]